MRITFKRKALHQQIAEIAYVTADVATEETGSHTLHQTFDICNEENIGRVDSLLSLAFSEVVATLSAITRHDRRNRLPDLESAAVFSLCLSRDIVSTPLVLRIKETIKEYLISRTLHGWLSVTLPAAAPPWERKAEMLLTALASASSRVCCAKRRCSPF